MDMHVPEVKLKAMQILNPLTWSVLGCSQKVKAKTYAYIHTLIFFLSAWEQVYGIELDTSKGSS